MSILVEASRHASNTSWSMISISSYKESVKTLDTHLKRRKLETILTCAVSETHSSMAWRAAGYDMVTTDTLTPNLALMKLPD